ncbi:prenyltransferase [Halostreptopolyspora alba]|uniref:Prenyltransferase n=1 Tax=Halostreptopolyspora alba TaxID=2487137 RepID=A0A3N0EFK4_9ACTN|nr:prenyltransferase [Nocardiopsaceae bacterium YIM 96095]
MSSDTLHAAEHFVMRNARLIDRHRFAFHFQSGPAEPIRTVLDAYRNVDGGYGNGLDPDLRGHGSQPVAVEFALRYLDEIGTMPQPLLNGICTYLNTVTDDKGGVPCVLPSARHTEAAPWWREYTDFRGSLNPTATITGLLHKNHVSHPWRDHATAFCWSQLAAMNWTTPSEAIAVCTFLQHVPERTRALRELDRIAPMITAVIEPDPTATGHVRKPLDIAPHPDHIATRLFTDSQIHAHLDALQRTQQDDGGWPLTWDNWTESTTPEWRGIVTLRRLLTLRAHGRLDTHRA